MQRKYGVGPGSRFVVAVSVTVLPAAALVLLAVSPTVQPLELGVGEGVVGAAAQVSEPGSRVTPSVVLNA